MNARTGRFWGFQAIFWSIAGAALFVSGATQMPFTEALVRNLFLLVAGFLSSFFLAMLIDQLRFMPILKLRLTSYGLAYVIAVFCVFTINAITFTLRGGSDHGRKSLPVLRRPALQCLINECCFGLCGRRQSYPY